MTLPLRLFVFVVALVCAHGAIARSDAAREADAQQQLERVRQEIRALGAAQQALDAERGAASRELREADRRIAAAAATLAELDAEAERQQQALHELQSHQHALELGLQAQKQQLASLFRAAYALGRHEQLKLLLSPDHGEQVGRAMAYQRYFKHARMRRIDALLAQLSALADARAAVAEQGARAAAARDAQQAALSVLEGERAAQQALLRDVESRFADGRSRLAALGRDEAALLKLIEQLKDVFADIPRQLDAAQPLARRRGQLPRPLAGRVGTAYGSRLPDGRTSSGWWIGADAGSPVRAIAHGRVAFADWMSGYGLLLIIDHGDGFMSLYASNETLSREPGDWVQAGDVVATVGSSGGQARAGLYFELRQNGRPVDPKAWLKP